MTDLCIGGPAYEEAMKKGKKDQYSVAVDIGSNTGGVAHSLCTKGYNKIHLFEPSPKMLEGSKLLLKDYVDKCVFNQKGVSDQKKTLKNVKMLQSWILCGDGEHYNYPVSPGAVALQPDPFDCELTTLDEYCEKFDRLDLLKIDVEGYEFKVLKGGKNTIKTFKPIIILELSLYINDIEKNSIPKFIDHLYQIGYNIFDMKNIPVSKERMISQYPYHSSCDVVMYPRLF